MKLSSVILSLLCLSFIARLTASQDESSMPPEEKRFSYNQYDAVSHAIHHECDCPWHEQDTLTGNWFGERCRLCSRGIDFNFNYTSDLAGNPVGGKSRGFSNTGSTNLGMILDFERMAGWKGWYFMTTAVWRYGHSLSVDHIGNEFNVQQNYGGQNLRLYSMYLQRDFGENFKIKIGRLGAGDDFLSRPQYWNYMSNAIDGNPTGVFRNNTGFSAYPNATWGAVVRAKLDPSWELVVGVYEILSQTQTSMSAHGADFSFRNGDGVNLDAQLTWKPSKGIFGMGMPGSYSVGVSAGWMSPYSIDNIDYYNRNVQMWLMLEQMVWQPENAQPDQGILPWLAFIYAPLEDRSQMPYFIAAGITGKGIIPDRPDDVPGIGFGYGQYSNRLGGDLAAQRGSYEAIFEINYKWQVNRWCYVLPNVQYVLHTKGGIYPDALVLGAQIGITF